MAACGEAVMAVRWQIRTGYEAVAPTSSLLPGELNNEGIGARRPDPPPSAGFDVPAASSPGGCKGAVGEREEEA
uniref:Uncharacterized protein n=1 Tax=Oryza sativa subsp. japonica TaxID=39947 RepID=Q6ZHT7_ORYSJ|nr:hypothetical protein [Oryza sativa Japonica Group]